MQLIPVLTQLTEAIGEQLIPVVEGLGQAMRQWQDRVWPSSTPDTEPAPIGPIHMYAQSQGSTGLFNPGETYPLSMGETMAYTYPTLCFPGTTAATRDVQAAVPGEYHSWYCVVQFFSIFTLVYVPVTLHSGPILDDEGIPIIYRAIGEPIPTSSGVVAIIHTTDPFLEIGQHAISPHYLAITSPTGTLKGQRALHYLEVRAKDRDVKGRIPHSYVIEDGPS